MINKIVRMLNQEQGFTLMELMIVVVIIGILAGVAVPVYNGLQKTARQKVGEANAEMLNRGIITWVALEAEGAPEEVDGYGEEHQNDLLEWLGLDEVEYVRARDVEGDPADPAGGYYIGDSEAETILRKTDENGDSQG